MLQRLKRFTDPITERPFFHDSVTGRDYQRFVAGLCWPYLHRPGALVLLGETKDLSLQADAFEIFRLHEFEDESPDALCREFGLLVEEFGQVRVYGEPLHPMRILVGDWNRQRDLYRKPRLEIWTVPDGGVEKSKRKDAWLGLLQRRIGSQKTLHFGESRIPTAVQPMLSATWEEEDSSPLAFAFLAALAGIDLNKSAYIQGGLDNRRTVGRGGY